MAVSLLLVLQLVAQSPSANPQGLLEQLGSTRYAEREAAARSLEKLGREAIPVLQLGRDSRDLEIRTRAAVLLQRIEESLLTRPTMVWLNFKDVSLADAVLALSRQTGMKISLVPENLPRWDQERLNLQETEPLPFWSAMDRLAAAASLRADVELRGFGNHRQPTFSLTDRIARPVSPTSDHGPFRISLLRLESFSLVEPVQEFPLMRRNPGLAGRAAARQDRLPPQLRSVTSTQCSVHLLVMAEPRLSVSQNGPVQILEASDNLGNSLRMANPAAPVLVPTGTLLAGSCSSVVHVGAPLNRPQHPGQTIKALRGSVPLRITARQPEPLVVPLASSAGKTFDSRDLHIVVHELRLDPNTHQRQLDLTVHETGSEGIPSADTGAFADLGSRLDPHQQNIEIIDARDQIVPWIQTNTDLESSRITLTMAGAGVTDLKELRYYRLSETAVNVPFSFADVPMP